MDNLNLIDLLFYMEKYKYIFIFLIFLIVFYFKLKKNIINKIFDFFDNFLVKKFKYLLPIFRDI